MREIKFRAFSDGEMMLPGESFHLTDGVLDPGSWVLMQYTGLKDKNGTEIYEGDILETIMAKKPIRGVMEWDERAHGWGKIHPIFKFEVIGNIHEHPELLTHNSL